MKYFYPLVWLALLAAPACKKDDAPAPPVDPPQEQKQPIAAFALDSYGCDDLWDLYDREVTAVTLKNLSANTDFSYEVTGANGLKTITDALEKGSGKADATGAAAISLKGLLHYKDGNITIKVKSAGKTFESSTKKEEFIIHNYKEFLSMTMVNYTSGNNPADVYVQAQDFAFPDSVLTVSPAGNKFHGTYDGQGHKITNLAITSTEPKTTEDIGLFAYIDAQVVLKNIRLELAPAGISTSNTALCGGIAGFSYGGIILNCSVKGSLSATKAFSSVGGIVGELLNGRLIGCSFNGSIEGYSIGGVAGAMDLAYVNMCYSNFTLKGNYAAGLIGAVVDHGGIEEDTIYNSYAYMQQPQSPYLYSLFPIYSGGEKIYLYGNCFSNAGTKNANAIMYTTPQELNSQLANLQVNSWPKELAAPAGNKPFKTTTDATKPAILWWEE